MAEKKRPSVSKKRRAAPSQGRASSSSAAGVRASLGQNRQTEQGEASLPNAADKIPIDASAEDVVAGGAADAVTAGGETEGVRSAADEGASAASGDASKSAAQNKRRSISQREKKKAAKAKIVVPAAKKRREDAATPGPDAGEPADGRFGDAGVMGSDDVMGSSGAAIPKDVDAAEASYAVDADGGSGRAADHAGCSGEADDCSRSGGAADAGKRRKRRSVKKRRVWPKVVLGVFLALTIAIVGGFSWSRWLHGDDVVDMLGTWYVPGSEKPITVEGNSIVLADDVSYEYVLDTGSKTITFSFGPMQGRGYYHFSFDRSMLVIQDGEFSWTDTLSRDIAWAKDELLAFLLGKEFPVPPGENVLVLARAPLTEADALQVESGAPESGASEGDMPEGGALSGNALSGNAPEGDEGSAEQTAEQTAEQATAGEENSTS